MSPAGSSELVLAPSRAASCFHCGLPIPKGVTYHVHINDVAQAMCCRGCQAVAQAIMDNGLGAYYHNRTAMPGRAQEALPDELAQLRLYDHPQIQSSFVNELSDNRKQAVLILEGITCPACVWLNERHLMQLPGMLAVQVNYASHRARITWDESLISLSTILSEIQHLGYRAHPYNAQSAALLREQQRKKDLRRLAVAGIASAQVMMLAVALYAGHWYGMEPATAQMLRWISLALTLPVMLYAARPFYSAAWSAFKIRRPNMDVPVVIALLSAFIGSLINTGLGRSHVYYDAITMFVLFLLGARLLEVNARQRSVEAAENLLRLAPAMATRIRDGAYEVVPVLALQAGDQLLIKPGEAFAADGIVESGDSGVDEALLTGESRLVEKHPGSKVIAGSVNVDGPLVVRVQGLGEQTVLASIVRLLDQALAEKPRLAQLTDRVAGYFTWALLGLSTLVGLLWLRLDPNQAFDVVLSILVVTCPCALSLAAPAAMASAASHLLARGVLITSGHALETLAQVNHVILDKTGTLTYGKPQLQAIHVLGELNREQCLRIAASLEQASEHPLAAAFMAQIKPEHLLVVSDNRNTAGRGVSGRIEGKVYFLGQPQAEQLASEQVHQQALHHAGQQTQPLTDSTAAAPGVSSVWLSDEQGLLARFEFADALRADAAAMVASLRARKVAINIFSGDDAATVRYLGAQLGIDDTRGGMQPAEKLAALRALQQQGAVVLMVGDGVNDAPVLGAAQVSLAMGSGTQVARASSDIILLSERLLEVAHTLSWAQQTVSVMRQNFAWAIAYNLVAVPLAALGWVSPWLAALGMSASSLIVVANALRLK